MYPNTTKKSGISAVEHCGDTGCLYNIQEDPEERVNLADKMPDVLKDMQMKLEKYSSSRFNPDRGNTWPGACDCAMKTYNGYWGPFLP